MLNSDAKIKAVRPFKRLLDSTPLDQDYKSWKDRNINKQVIELGCGVGLHPIQFAKAHPNINVTAIERTKNKFESFERRAQSHKLPNLYPIGDDALYWLPRNITAESIDQYFILYPNPYPKEKQANKRWHRSSLFEFILSTLKKGGRVSFASNEKWYIEECLLYCRDYWNLKLTNHFIIDDLNSPNPRTHFEKKYRQRGQICQYLEFQK